MDDHADSAHQNIAGRLEDLGLQDESEFDRVDWLEQHEPRMRRRLEQLYTNQGEIDSLLQQLLQERKALDLKYQKLLGPHYNERRQMIKGDCLHGSDRSCDAGVPGFWLKVLRSHSELEERITPQDATILEHLVDIRGVRFGEEGSGSGSCGYIVKFVFSPNSHFSEEELSVKAEFADQEETVIRSIEGTSISWSSKGANPAVKIMTKKGPDGAQKMKLTSVDSFFKLFQPIRPPEDGKLGINEYEEMKEEAEDCLAILSLLVDEMIPHAMRYFSGEKTFDDDLDADSDELDDDDTPRDGAEGASNGMQLQPAPLSGGDNVDEPGNDCKQQ